jgi:hypothetical protein
VTSRQQLCYRCENFKFHIVVLYSRLIITFDEATVCQLHTHSNRHVYGDNFARGSLPSVVRYILAAYRRDAESFVLKMKAIISLEISVLIRTTRRLHILENSILDCHRRENIKPYRSWPDRNWFRHCLGGTEDNTENFRVCTSSISTGHLDLKPPGGHPLLCYLLAPCLVAQDSMSSAEYDDRIVCYGNVAWSCRCSRS